MALRRLGLAYCDQGRFEDAVNCLRQSLALCREVQDLHGEAIIRGSLGEVHYHAGFHHGAIECYGESLRIHREIGDRRRVVNCSAVGH
jgi:tetratricopeptide (TPR) repeat protein